MQHIIVRIYSYVSFATAAALMAVAGCSQDGVDHSDLQTARDRVEQERQETEEVRREVQQQVAQEKEETEATRHEVMKPESEAVRDEENETAKTTLEGNEKIEQEEQETREAEENLAEVKAKLKAQKERNAFLEKPNDLLQKASLRIETLKKEADAKQGDVEEATKEQIETLQAAHDKLKDAIEEMKSSNPLGWKKEKPEVEVAQKELQKQLDDAEID